MRPMQGGIAVVVSRIDVCASVHFGKYIFDSGGFPELPSAHRAAVSIPARCSQRHDDNEQTCRQQCTQTIQGFGHALRPLIQQVRTVCGLGVSSSQAQRSAFLTLLRGPIVFVPFPIPSRKTRYLALHDLKCLS